MKNQPKKIITDKYRGYMKITKDNFPKSEHERYDGFEARINNNLVERLNGTIKDRTKVMRGMGSLKTAQNILNGFRIYYNFIKKHEKLGITPAEACGINLQLGQNKWLGLLKLSMNK